MKTRILMMTLALALLSMSACTKDDKEIPFDIPFSGDTRSPVIPVTDAQMWPTPTIDDSNLQGEGYNYDYWKEHKAEAQTGDELLAMCNVPTELLKNMSTPNLAWTCFNHPYNNNWFAFNNIYDGILSVMTRSNGYQELMKRKSGAQAVIDLYCRLGCKRLEMERPGITLVEEFDLTSWVLVMCTAADHLAFSSSQVQQLTKEMLNKWRLHSPSSYSRVMLELSSYLLGAFLAYHYDTSLSEEHQALLANFIKYRCMYGGTAEDLSRSHSIIFASLHNLAGNNMNGHKCP